MNPLEKYSLKVSDEHLLFREEFDMGSGKNQCTCQICWVSGENLTWAELGIETSCGLDFIYKYA